MVKTRICFILLSLMLGIANICAQQSTTDNVPVNIVIVDEYGEPLPGATITVEGKPGGVISDNDGKATLSVPRGVRITISYVGMESTTIRITKKLSGNVELKSSLVGLDQVVVTGYQRTTKRRATGSVATLTAEDLQDKPLANVDMLLQGKVAGVDIKATSGRPGESATVRIRGTNTITGNAEPLWVIDGVPLQKDIPTISSSQIKAGDFNDIFANGISGINPNDIESVTILKDASAAAIYGSRAAGGVIVITTKRGKEGRMRVNYSANVSVTTSPPRDANLMNSREKLAWEQELWDEFSKTKFENGETYPVIGVVGMIRSGYGKYAGMTTAEQDAEIESLGSSTTDWFKEIFRNSVSHSHYLSFSGGTDKNAYYVSLGYNSNEGLLKRNSYERYNISTKIDMKPSSRVKLGVSVDMGWQTSTSPSLNTDPFTYAYFANPYEKVYNEDGSYAADNTYYTIRSANGTTDLPMPSSGFNIMREINETTSKSTNLDATVIGNLSVNIIDNLSFEGLASYSYVNSTNDNINGRNTYAAWLDRPFEINSLTSTRTYSSITQSSAYNKSYNLRGQFLYHNTFGDHYISGLLGSEIRGQYAKSIYEKRYAYDELSGNSAMPTYPESTTLTYSNMLNYANIMDGLSGQSISEDRFASFYLSLDYVFKKRYIASFTARTDGSNNFGSKEQFNPTGSFGLSWNVDQEKFFDIVKPVVSSFTLRAAIGYTGNINKSVYPQLVMDYSKSYRRTDDDYYRMGYLQNAPNPSLRWEKTRDWKVSADIGLFNERVRLTGEIYNRRTYDAVSSITVPYTTGFSTQSYNTSTLSNSGMEFTISTTFLNTKDWKGSASANIAYNRNKLIEYEAPSSGISSGTYVGYPLGSIFSGKVIGIDKQLGIYTYEARPDATFVTEADRSSYKNYLFYLGTSNAPINGGYSVSLSYRKITLSVGGSYSINGKIINNIDCPVGYNSLSGTIVERIPSQINDLYVNFLNVNKNVVNRWTVDNPRTDANPRIIDAYGDYLGLYNYATTSSIITNASLLENISYFKVGSLSLSYLFDERVLRPLRISSLGLSFTMNNVLTLTNYTGIDPETPGAVYPLARTFTFGLSLGF